MAARGTKLGPVMLVAELAAFGVVMAASTMHRVLVRRGISRLADLDVTGEPMRVPAATLRALVPGQMVHLDVKKIGRIPDGGGHRVHGRGTDAHRASKRGPRPGYAYLHSAIDDCSRLAYTEELADEKLSPPPGSGTGRGTFFAAHGIETSTARMTDNGSCYRVAVFNQPWPPATSSTATPGRTGRRPTARSNGSTAPWPANGPTSGPGPPTRNDSTPCPPSCTATTSPKMGDHSW